LRINSGADDAAGLAISQNLQAQINGVNQSIQNLSNAINVLQTADTGLSTVHDLMLRMMQLGTAGNDASLSKNQKADLVNELEGLLNEINATATRTQFNGIHLLDNGSFTPSSNTLAMATVATTDGQAGGSSPGVTEAATFTFSNLAAGQTVSIAGRTFTAGIGGASGSDVAAAMAQTASLISGTSVSGAAVGTFSGAVTGWTTGGQSGANLTYTSTTPSVNVSDLTVPSVSVSQGYPLIPGVTENLTYNISNIDSGSTFTIGGLTYNNNNPSASKISFNGDLQAGDIFNIDGYWNGTEYNGGLTFTATGRVSASDMAMMIANMASPTDASSLNSIYSKDGDPNLPGGPTGGPIDGYWSGTLIGWTSGSADPVSNSVLLTNDSVGVYDLYVNFARDESGALCRLDARQTWWGIAPVDVLVPPYSNNLVKADNITYLDASDFLSEFSNNHFDSAYLNNIFDNLTNRVGQPLAQGWAGGVSGWEVTSVANNDLTFSSTTPNTNVADNFPATIGTVPLTQTQLYIQGAAEIPGHTEAATVTFSNLAAGQTVSIAGRTFTAGSGGALGGDVAAAMAQTASLTSGTSVSGAAVGTFSGAITGWTTGAQSGANLTYTSTTPSADVSNLTAPSVSLVNGQAGSSSAGVTETAAVTFANLAAGQSVSLAGLTFTSGGSEVSASQVASAFENLSSGATTGGGIGYGSYSGTFSNWNTGGASDSDVIFTSTTSNANVSDLTVSSSSIPSVSSASGSQILDFQSGAFSSSYISIKTINIRTDSNESNQLMQDLANKVNALISDLSFNANGQVNKRFLDFQSTLTKAIDYISKERATFASQLNRASFIVSNLQGETVALQNSKSLIIDTDFALETAKLAKGQILQQSSTAMLAQANQEPNVIIGLLNRSFSGNYNIQNFVY
jgi:flagellin-like hook-associated protein FlgL